MSPAWQAHTSGDVMMNYASRQPHPLENVEMRRHGQCQQQLQQQLGSSGS